MRIIASIYLAIALANFGIWLTTGLNEELFPTPYAYLTWVLYFFSLLSLLAYILQKLMIPRRLWQLVFAVYVSARLFELGLNGHVLVGESLNATLNLVSSYLWLTIPAGLAMWYLSFRLPTSHSQVVGDVDRGQGRLVPHD